MPTLKVSIVPCRTLSIVDLDGANTFKYPQRQSSVEGRKDLAAQTCAGVTEKILESDKPLKAVSADAILRGFCSKCNAHRRMADNGNEYPSARRS